MSDTPSLQAQIAELQIKLQELYAQRRLEILRVATTPDPVTGKPPRQKDVAALFGVAPPTVFNAVHHERRQREKEENRQVEVHEMQALP